MSEPLKKIAAGLYESRDGRFVARDAYDPSGAAWVRTTGRNSDCWELADRVTRKTTRHRTLADCRERIGEIRRAAR